MPKFTSNHIQSLIYFSKDTTHIANFPFNPISSRTPYPSGREYCILGECLLWTVEGIRNGISYGSLDPYLVDKTLIESERCKGLIGVEILVVREFYQDWWRNYQDKNWIERNPLEKSHINGSSFFPPIFNQLARVVFLFLSPKLAMTDSIVCRHQPYFD